MTRRTTVRLVAAASFAALLGGVVIADSGTAAPSVTPATGEFADLIPRPVAATAGTGDGFTLSEETAIRAGEAETPIAEMLTGLLEPATGLEIEIVPGEATSGDIRLEIVEDDTADPESYDLVVEEDVSITAPTAHGLFNGIQTLRQLLPAWIESSSPVHTDWHIPPVDISDEPRFEYRGVMVDLSRAFLTVEQVEHVIDQMAALKLNQLHLHLTDDPAWRIAIDQPEDSPLDYEDLTTYGAQGGNLSNVDDADRFYYTRAEYRALVDYASDRFIEVVPEVDGPAHSTAAMAAMADLNASGERAPIFVPTNGERTYFDPNVPELQGFLTTVFAQLADDGNSPYLHIGGDEAFGMSEEDYDSYLEQARTAVEAADRSLIVWNEAADHAGEGDVVQFWLGGAGADNPDAAVLGAVERGAKVIMSPAARVYLDQAYPDGSPRNIGAPNYACGGSCDWRNSYNWDPVKGGLTEADVLGVEATMWGYSHDTQDYLLNPRLAAAAEVAWSPAEGKDTEEFGSRLANHSVRYALNDVNFKPMTSIDWRTGAVPAQVCSSSLEVSGQPFGYAVAEQYQPKLSVAWIDYGDGSGLVPAPMRTAYEQTEARTHGLMTVLGNHTYAEYGTYEASLAFQATSAGTVETVTFTVVVDESCADAQGPGEGDDGEDDDDAGGAADDGNATSADDGDAAAGDDGDATAADDGNAAATDDTETGGDGDTAEAGHDGAESDAADADPAPTDDAAAAGGSDAAGTSDARPQPAADAAAGDVAVANGQDAANSQDDTGALPSTGITIVGAATAALLLAFGLAFVARRRMADEG